MPIFRDDLTLYNGLELEAEVDTLPGLSPLERESYKRIVGWTRQYLCRPHSDLGREGPVCPFTQPSLTQRQYWLTNILGSDIDQRMVAETIERFREWYLELEPLSGPSSILKTIVIVFPELSAEAARIDIEAVHKKIKPEFVRKGLMLGQFYEGCPETGLWNEHFYPLESPLPLLVIRSMVPSDFPFLHGRRGNADMLIAYLNRFGTNIPPDVKRLMVEALETSELTLRGRNAK